MMPFIILLGFVIIALVVVIALLFREQKTNVQTRSELDKTHQEKKEVHSENTELNTRIEHLENENTKLKAIVKQETKAIESGHKPAEKHIQEFMNTIKLKDIMSDNLIMVQVDAPFSDVPKKMKEFSVRHLPVVDQEKKLVGLITQRMMYKIKSPRKLMDGQWHYDEQMLNNVILKHVMQREVFALSGDRPMGEALLKIVSAKYGCIPIVDKDQKLEGLVTRNDILKIAANIYQKN